MTQWTSVHPIINRKHKLNSEHLFKKWGPTVEWVGREVWKELGEVDMIKTECMKSSKNSFLKSGVPKCVPSDKSLNKQTVWNSKLWDYEKNYVTEESIQTLTIQRKDKVRNSSSGLKTPVCFHDSSHFCWWPLTMVKIFYPQKNRGVEKSC